MSDNTEEISCGAPPPLLPHVLFCACDDDGAADVGGEEFPEEGAPAMGGGEVVPPMGGGGGAGAGAADGPTFRTIKLGASAECAELLKLEPLRLGPPRTGPGLLLNKVVTAQYTALNFVPKNLWNQFHRMTNCYFLFISFLQVGDGVAH